MYNFKEKKLHFNALRNPDAAAFDLELLQKIAPSHPKLRTFVRDAKRYTDDILYALLDLVSREDIRNFRRAKQEESLQVIPEDTPSGEADNPPPVEEKAIENTSVTTTEETSVVIPEKTPETTDTNTGTTIADVSSDIDEVNSNANPVEETNSRAASAEQMEEMKQSLEYTEERADEAQQRVEEAEEAREEAEQRAEEAEERADAAESALEEEKKKGQSEQVAAPAKSKSTKNTHK